MNMRLRKQPKSKRAIRKRRRSNEPKLREGLRHYLELTASDDNLSDEESFKITLPIRRALYGLTHDHLKLTRDWGKRSWFLELPDVDSISIIGKLDSGFQISGEIIWWAEGKDAEGEWWPRDRIPNVGKLGGKYMTEPFRARVFPLWNKRRGLKYEIEFGRGSDYKFFTNRRERFVKLEAV